MAPLATGGATPLDRILAVLGLTLIVTASAVTACDVSTKHDVRVRGGTENELIIAENFCDKETYPSAIERRICKEQLLAVWSRCASQED